MCFSRLLYLSMIQIGDLQACNFCRLGPEVEGQRASIGCCSLWNFVRLPDLPYLPRQAGPVLLAILKIC